MKTTSRLLRLLGLGCLLIGDGLSVAVAQNVSNTTTHLTYATITDALAALTADGQTLHIGPGTYTEPMIDIAWAVTLQGNDAATTILQPSAAPGTAATRVARVWIPEEFGVTLPVVFERLTLRHGNTAGSGGALFVEEGSAIVRHCIVIRNTAGIGGGLAGLAVAEASLSVEDSLIVTNTATTYGGGFVQGEAARCTIAGNHAPSGGGATYARLTDCTVADNTADSQGGGLQSGTAWRCRMQGNAATYGGASYNAILVNTLATGNTAVQSGGAMYLGQATNCTLAANQAGTAGGGLFNGTVVNTILHANTGGDFGGGAVLLYSRAAPLAPGSGNIDAPPSFNHPAGGDYTLAPESPCRDTGANAWSPPGTDLAGAVRIQGSAVDMGAFEATPANTVATPSFQPAGGTTFETTVNVSMTCTTPDAAIRYTLDGSEPTAGSALYAVPVQLTQTTTVKARAFAVGMIDSAVASASYTRTVTLATAVDAPDLTFTTGGDAPWFVQSTVVHTGEEALQSGSISHRQSSWVETTVEGAGALSFWWKVSCEDDVWDDWDYVRVAVDGVERARMDGEQAWTKVVLELGEGTHTVRWTYAKDRVESAGQDCAWLDTVAWTPAGSGVTRLSPVPVPHAWLDEFDLPIGGDYEAAAMADVDGDGHRAWQEHVTGSCPTNRQSVFRVALDWVGGSPRLSWDPDLASERLYTVWGKARLGDAAWQTPTNAASRFFRVEVTLPQ